MKKILIIIVIALFSVPVGAQETKPTTTEKQEKSCTSHDASSNKMTKEEIAICKANSKAQGKKCDAKAMSNCKNESKKCSSEDKEGKKCCAKKQ
jgi:hypothetical protein